jgi:ribosomal protein S25
MTGPVPQRRPQCRPCSLQKAQQHQNKEAAEKGVHWTPSMAQHAGTAETELTEAVAKEVHARTQTSHRQACT